MRLKIELFRNTLLIGRRLFYVPVSVKTIRELELYIAERCYAQSLLPILSVLLTLDGFDLDPSDPLDVLSDGDTVRADAITDTAKMNKGDTTDAVNSIGLKRDRSVSPVPDRTKLQRQGTVAEKPELFSRDDFLSQTSADHSGGEKTEASTQVPSLNVANPIGFSNGFERSLSGQNKTQILNVEPTCTVTKFADGDLSLAPPLQTLEVTSSSSSSTDEKVDTESCSSSSSSSCSSSSDEEDDEEQNDEQSIETETQSSGTFEDACFLNTAAGYTVGDKLRFQVASLLGGSPFVSEEQSGKIIRISVSKNEEEPVLSIRYFDDATRIEAIPASHLINVLRLNDVPNHSFDAKVDDALAKKATLAENETTTTLPLDSSQTTTSSTCASYTEHHPVLGSIEIPCSLNQQEVARLIAAKLNAVRCAVRRQIDFYFSDKNYYHDNFLRSQEDPNGWISLSLVGNFNRIKNFTTNLDFISSIIHDLRNVELSSCKTLLRKRQSRSVTIPLAEQRFVGNGTLGPLTAEGDVPGTASAEPQPSRRYVPRRRSRL